MNFCVNYIHTIKDNKKERKEGRINRSINQSNCNSDNTAHKNTINSKHRQTDSMTRQVLRSELLTLMTYSVSQKKSPP